MKGFLCKILNRITVVALCVLLLATILTGCQKSNDDTDSSNTADSSEQCRTCTWLAVCNGGCPKARFASAENGEAGLNYLCGGLRKFFAHVERPLRRIVELRRLGRTPAAIVAQLRAESQARWRGVGRNDPCPCGSGRKAKHCCWSKRL